MASLKANIESAFKSYLDASSIGATVYAGFSTDTKTPPCVVVNATQAQEDPPHSGIYRVTVELQIRGIAKDGTDFDTITEAVRDAVWLECEELGTQLNQQGISDLNVWGASAAHSMSWSLDEDCWVETQTVEVIAAPSDFGA